MTFLFNTIVHGQTVSNQGTEFWAVFPTHAADVDPNGNPLPSNLSIFITGGQASGGMIYAGGFSQHFTVTANKVTEIAIPRTSVYINDTESGQILSSRAIHIVTDDGQAPVVVYAHIFAGHRSAASLILPGQALGQSYYSINYQQHDTEGKNFIVIAATEPNTKVHIMRGNTELVAGGVTLSNVNDVYEYLSADDLSGVSVSVDEQTSACKHFALFSGSSGVYIAQDNCTPASLDPLFQQCFPVESWGYHYGFIPFSMNSPAFTHPVRTAGQYVRVVAKQNGTQVKINGKIVAPSLNAGDFYTSASPLTTPSDISANYPVCVAQYALTQSCSDLVAASPGKVNSYSDPDMVILNPIEYQIKDITVYSSSRENITEQYMNILIATRAAASFKINGVKPAEPFKPFAALPGYSYLQLYLSTPGQNTYHLTANEGFNAEAYGFGNVESYSYSAGTNLAANQSISAYTTHTNLLIDSACANDDYYFKLVLPFKSPQIMWQMDSKEIATEQTDPQFETLSVNGVPLYAYRFPKTAAYKFAGTHAIKILAAYPPTMGGCSNGSQEINGSFYVNPSPKTNFTYSATDCYNTISFTDISNDNGVPVVSRIWTFGDTRSSSANTSTLPNPVHVFSKSGDYNVKLTVINTFGCQKDTSQKIHINANVKPGFTNTTPVCTGAPVFFTDISQDNGFGITERRLFFGDGDSLIVKDNLPAKHIYASGGLYTAKMVLVNQTGCLSDTVEAQLEVTNKAKAAFTIPSACVADPVVNFANLSAVAGNNNHTIKYVWNFGDEFASTSNPNITTTTDGHHHFTKAGVYNITLVAITGDCADTLTQALTVNSGAPIADFDIPATPVCAGQPINIKDLSHMPGFGKITRLLWYLDALGNRNNILDVNAPGPDSTYQVVYPVLAEKTLSHTYTIQLQAFSGSSCVDVISKKIEVVPPPQVAFDSIPPICVTQLPFQITQAKEMNGQAGNGVYQGDGITANGLFDPVTAGTGSHTITYLFTNLANCQSAQTRVIEVLEQPQIAVTSNLTVLLGNKTQLKPVYKGNNLQYSWLPADGLNDTNVPYPVASPLKTTTYKVTVFNGTCYETGEINVIVIKPPLIFNTFTPNGDGINDRWVIVNAESFPGIIVDIFNRYGAQVFHSVGYGVPWDGKYHGSNVPAGTYYYVIKVPGEQKPISGYVEVLR